MASGADYGITKSVLNTVSITTDTECPHCGRTMVRVPRKQWQRLVSKVITVTRWECCGESWLVLNGK